MSRNFMPPTYAPSPTGMAGPTSIAPAQKMQGPLVSSAPKMPPIPGTPGSPPPAPVQGPTPQATGFARPGIR